MTEQEDGKEGHIRYLPDTLNDEEKNLNSTQYVFLAIVWAVPLLRSYLKGTAPYSEKRTTPYNES